MMDGKTIRNKLVGSDDERAVSPVIGVILMVAITVILAAVIATLVMDFGDSTDAPMNANVDADIHNDGNVTLTVLDAGDASEFELRGSADNIPLDDDLNASTGVSLKLHEDYGSGNLDTVDEGTTINIVAIDGDREEQAGSFEVPEGFH